MNNFLQLWHDSSSYIEAHTSGSTGTPKKIHLPKALMRRSARSTIQFFSIPPGARLHSCVSAQFIGGMMVAVRADEVGGILTWEKPSNTPTLSGNQCVLSKSDCHADTADSEIADPDIANPGIAASDIAASNAEEIFMVSVVASQMPWLLQERHHLPRVRHYLIGGGVIPPGIREEIVRSGVDAWESYGMTETASHIAVRRVSSDDCVPFHPLPGISVMLDDRGCLCISREGCESVATNDIADIDDEGGFLIKGRADDVIVSGGKKIHPAPLESRMAPYIEYPFYICGKSDPKWGQRVVLRIVAPPFDTTTLLRTLHDVLPPYEVPKEVEFISSLPLTPNGKIRRHDR